MGIDKIGPYQELQNAYRPGSGKESIAKDNLNVVHDAPFFPIAKYQRPDLIKKAPSAETESERSVRAANNQPLQGTPSVNKGKASAPDTPGVASSEEIQPGSIVGIEI